MVGEKMVTMRSRGEVVRQDAARRVQLAAKAGAAAHRAVAGQIDRRPGPWTDRLASVVVETPGCEPVIGWLDNAVFCLTACIADGAGACGKLVASPEAAIPAIVTARAVLEATSQLVFLLGGGPTPAVEHAILLAAQDCADERAMVEWADERGLSREPSEAKEKAIRDAATAMGYKIGHRHWGGVKGLVDREGNAIELPSATQLIRRMADDSMGADVRAAWMISSGMAHSRTWATTHEIRSPDTPMPAAAALTAATTTISAVAVAIDQVGLAFGDESLRGTSLHLRTAPILLGTPPQI